MTTRKPPTENPVGTCDWGDCNRDAVTWRLNGSPNSGEWLPVCVLHVGPPEPTPTTGPIELPDETSKRTAAFHLAEAEAHLLRADEHVAAGRDSEAIARLLAASANAQIGALKLAERHEAILERLAEYLADLTPDTPQQ